MIRENEYVRFLPDTMTDREKFEARMRYRNMSKKEKKKISSHITKYKQNMNPSQWMQYVNSRIEDGQKIHESNQDNIRRDTSLIRKSLSKKY